MIKPHVIDHARRFILVFAVSACGVDQAEPAEVAASEQALSSPEAGPATPAAAQLAVVAAAPPQSAAEQAARAAISAEDPSELPPEERRAFLTADRAARREALAIKRALLTQAEEKRRGRPASEDRDLLDRQISDMRDNISRAETKLRERENML